MTTKRSQRRVTAAATLCLVVGALMIAITTDDNYPEHNTPLRWLGAIMIVGSLVVYGELCIRRRQRKHQREVAMQRIAAKMERRQPQS